MDAGPWQPADSSAGSSPSSAFSMPNLRSSRSRTSLATERSGWPSCSTWHWATCR